jgi:hypothetical protein
LKPDRCELPNVTLNAAEYGSLRIIDSKVLKEFAEAFDMRRKRRDLASGKPSQWVQPYESGLSLAGIPRSTTGRRASKKFAIVSPFSEALVHESPRRCC